jgi:hypothetical protein
MKERRSVKRIKGLSVALIWPLFLCGQDTKLTLTAVGHEPQAGYVVAEFSLPIAQPTIDRTKVTIRGGSVVKAFRESLQPTKVEVQFTGDLPSSSTLCFDAISYTAGGSIHTTTEKLCGSVTALDGETERQQLLTKFTNLPKASSDKDIFASGFVTTASAGTVGGADITLNKLIEASGPDTFLDLKKATEKNADAKHFEGGVKYQFIRPWSRQKIKALGEANPGQQMNDALRDLQRRIIAGSVFTIAAKLEGEATQFNVANFVGEGSYELRTETRALFSKKGFWRAFLMPIGFEGGKTLNTTGTNGSGVPASVANTAPPADWLARYKAGGGFTAFYEDWGNDLPVKRVELDVNAVVRDRFLNEAVFNNAANTINSTGKGIRAYGEAAVKVYVGQTSSGRYGVRLSYNRGSLPPVFARVKSFQFGFMFESSDDRTKSTK